VLVGLAAAATFAAGLIAVAQHANTTSAGYQLAVLERENLELSRIASQGERRVAELSTAPSARARGQSPAMKKLASLKWPKSWNVVRSETLAACASDVSAASASPVAASRTSGGAR
jgi:hypothetical protein